MQKWFTSTIISKFKTRINTNYTNLKAAIRSKIIWMKRLSNSTISTYQWKWVTQSGRMMESLECTESSQNSKKTLILPYKSIEGTMMLFGLFSLYKLIILHALFRPFPKRKLGLIIIRMTLRLSIREFMEFKGF
jgi:hypothetical protein